MICEGFNFTKRATGMFQSCVQTGSYGLRECAKGVQNILDIGANVGFFSVTARVLCPDAQVVSIEPDKPVFAQLCQNAKHMRIQPVNAGIGDGQPIKRYQVRPKARGSYGTRFDKDGNGAEEVPSFSVPHIVERFGMNQGLFIKIDCEGGERALVGHAESEQVIRDCVGIGGECHSIGIELQEYEAWLSNLIGATHTVTFFPPHLCSFEFRAIRKRFPMAQGQSGTPRSVRFTQEVRKYRRRRKEVWKIGEEQEFPADFASHMVCRGVAEYVL